MVSLKAAPLRGGAAAVMTTAQADLQAHHLASAAEICFSNTKRDQAFISVHTSAVLRECMERARVERLQILSAHRTIEQQAHFMYRSLHHVKPTFRGHAAEVERVAKSMVRQIQEAMAAGATTKRLPSVTDIVHRMAEAIERLERQHGILAISRHRVNPHQWAVLDISLANVGALKRRAELVRVLSSCPAISRIGVPQPLMSGADHEFCALGRWIHVEVPQP